jgi:hypothetical protein
VYEHLRTQVVEPFGARQPGRPRSRPSSGRG